jgi:hypothetical protein
MGKKLIDGVWVAVCDWTDENGNLCDLGTFGEPKMFVDPDGGRDPETHFQCGAHHGIQKQTDSSEFQLPEDHKLQDSTLTKGGANPGADVAVKLDGFKPDLEGNTWDGTEVKKG